MYLGDRSRPVTSLRASRGPRLTIPSSMRCSRETCDIIPVNLALAGTVLGGHRMAQDTGQELRLALFRYSFGHVGLLLAVAALLFAGAPHPTAFGQETPPPATAAPAEPAAAPAENPNSAAAQKIRILFAREIRED